MSVHRPLRQGWAAEAVDNRVIIFNPFVGKNYAIALSSSEEATKIAEYLMGGSPVDLKSDIVQLTADVLSEIGAASSELSSGAHADRYDRQVRFFDNFADGDQTGELYQRRLAASHVMMVGLGGIGSMVAMQLARVGVSRLTVFDHDTIELSNLSRQILFDETMLGMSKVVAGREALRLHGNLDVKAIPKWVSKKEDVLPYLNGVSLVLNGFGYPDPRDNQDGVFWAILNACGHNHTPCLVFGASAIGPVVRSPDEYINLMTTSSGQQFLRGVQRGRRLREPSNQPAFAPRVGILGSAVAWEACRYISRLPGLTLDRQVVALDTLQYEHSKYILD